MISDFKLEGEDQLIVDMRMPLTNPHHELIVKLARSLHSSGAPADELEQRMEQAAIKLGAPAHFFSTPTSLFVTFEEESQATRLVRVAPADGNLAKLARLYQLYHKIDRQEIDVAQALFELQEIEASNYDYGDLLNVVSYGATAAGVAVFLGGNLTALIAAGIIGLVVGVLVRVFERVRWPGQLVIVAAGFVSTVLASITQYYFPASSVELVMLASLIVLMPGLQITISVNELATQNLASGTARMAGAMTTFLTLIFGVVMGYGFADWWVTLPPAIQPTPLSAEWAVVAIVPVALALSILFRARTQDMPWMLLSASIAFATLKIAGLFFGPVAAAWSAALVVGVCSNLFARVRRQPASIMLMPGLILLVPGSMGFFGLSAIALHDDLPNGMKVVFTMILIAVSLVAGLLVSNVVCPIEPPSRR